MNSFDPEVTYCFFTRDKWHDARKEKKDNVVVQIKSKKKIKRKELSIAG